MDENRDKIALFMVLRNSKILPFGLAKGYSMEEINGMSYATMLEVIDGGLLDWERATESYEAGKAEYERQKAEGREW